MNIEVDINYLTNIIDVDEDVALKICDYLAGYRVYFKKVAIRDYQIKRDYKKLLEKQYEKQQILDELSNKYELTKGTIILKIRDMKL